MTTVQHIEAPDSVEAINQLYYSKGMTDGLPIVPPTADRIEAMIKASGRDPKEALGKVGPKWGNATVERVAVNAVMAGCAPEYMPVIVAAVEAITDETFNLYGIQATTNPVWPALMVNGPIRQELDINGGYNCFGQGWRANATIGRAIRFVCLNIGGGAPGVLDRATQGNPGKYGMCFAENEERSPWDPFHVDMGFKREENTVFVFGAGGMTNMVDTTSNSGLGILTTVANSMMIVGTNNMGGGDAAPVVVLCPEHAEIVARDGFSKQDVKQFIYENVRVPFYMFPRERQDSAAKRRPERGLFPYAMSPIAQSPDGVQVMVAGGVGPHSTFIQTAFTKGVIRPIRKP